MTLEPVILTPPDPGWLGVLREETSRVGALLVVDEIKTACRLAVGGGCERYGIRPDLVVGTSAGSVVAARSCSTAAFSSAG